MKRHLKKFFIPHEENNYHPHILHTKRATAYAISLLVSKIIVVACALLLPVQVFVLPDILAQEERLILAQTNALRLKVKSSQLQEEPLLGEAARMKAEDMAAHEYFSHMGPKGRDLRYFLDTAGYRFSVAGENLAMGFTSAADVMRAWEKSPTHYANLVDTDFSDIGIHMVPGQYRGVETIFVVQHFGMPAKQYGEVPVQKTPLAASPPVALAASPPAAGSTPAAKHVLGITQPVTPADESIAYDAENSSVRWEAVAGGRTAVFATALLTGDVRAARVTLQDYEMSLTQDPNIPERFVGQVTLPVAPRDLFRVITIPTLTVTDHAGTLHTFPIHWQEVLPVGPTPLQKYTQSKALFGDIARLNSLSHTLYGVFLGIYAVALVLCLCIELKKQHPHLITKASGFVVLLVLLFFT